jgi:hypothetical protein
VHHRTYERVGFERQSDLIVLCHDCHRDFHRSLTLRAIRATEHAPLAVTVADVLERVGYALNHARTYEPPLGRLTRVRRGIFCFGCFAR